MFNNNCNNNPCNCCPHNHFILTGPTGPTGEDITHYNALITNSDSTIPPGTLIPLSFVFTDADDTITLSNNIVTLQYPGTYLIDYSLRARTATNSYIEVIPFFNNVLQDRLSVVATTNSQYIETSVAGFVLFKTNPPPVPNTITFYYTSPQTATISAFLASIVKIS